MRKCAKEGTYSSQNRDPRMIVASRKRGAKNGGWEARSKNALKSCTVDPGFALAVVDRRSAML